MVCANVMRVVGLVTRNYLNVISVVSQRVVNVPQALFVISARARMQALQALVPAYVNGYRVCPDVDRGGSVGRHRA